MTDDLPRYHTLRLILGDQLNARHSWFQQKDSGVLYLIAELHQETGYVVHHIQKLCAFFAAMEHFAIALRQAGFQVLHLTLDDTQQDVDLPALLTRLAQQYDVDRIEYQRPDEYRLAQQIADFSVQSAVPVFMVESEHFLLPFDDIPRYFKPKTAVRMEHFYRKMRQRFQVLMNADNEPEGGKWNYDAANRNKLKPADLAAIPAPLCFANDVSHILARLKRHKVKSLGKAEEDLLWPVTRKQSKDLLTYFCEQLLPLFGTFQDAMTAKSEHKWSLYHSRLSFALNAKILHPMQVIQAAVNSYRDNPNIDIAQVEGFVRQILGWREYVRGMYWVNMPDYLAQNALDAQRDLPDYFWTGATKMNCLRHAIGQSLDTAYAHHIQRLMVTGNFCLLTEIEPQQVDAWYLGIYVDALEWVELPNTRGMSQFADGGWIASKPYAASGGYMQKMSDYCTGCHYQVKEKTGPRACPLNSLYWHFMVKHRDRLARNPRIGMIYGNWDKQNEEQKRLVLERAEWCLENLGEL
ncbi:cryptochrome/photolyase family protein [Maribrevibacterium harenarium]|uniref:Cryptochrome/photolyase family protein n=1 Tax=Maribrevibacterium harenarium TaxID=2589817 RepID=A0A501X139_9GAMM|nr:cryptochrome/photolyase family protein [Maribrevibacterium harenarium]TPE54091.1 cryptochrome/photolyase family protein [Maribrevibacterium harenarium]